MGMMALVIGVVLVRNGRVWSDQQGKGKKDESKETVELAATVKVTIRDQDGFRVCVGQGRRGR
ncbi:MAG: hypothetical protein ACXW38_07640 [Nitrospira sp.]